MLRSAISAFTRVFDALWRCAADPGSTPNTLRVHGSRLCGASWPGDAPHRRENAVPRPGHDAFQRRFSGLPKRRC